MNKKNRNIEAMFAEGFRPNGNGVWLDAYNKSVKGGYVVLFLQVSVFATNILLS